MIADYMEPITGYRAWNVHHNGLLIGQNHAEPWPPYTPFVARCGHAISPLHIKDGQWVSPPVWSCQCGVHAFNSQGPMLRRVEIGKNNWFGGIQDVGEEAMVWGEVKLWGRVIVHKDGYRAEFGYPGELWCEDERLCAKVASLYGVSCRFKAIDRPKPKLWDDGSINLGGGGAYFISQTFSFWRNKPVKPVKPAVPTPAVAPLLHAPSLAQIKAIGATSWQQQQAQMRAKQIPLLTQDWREMWRDGFKVKKDAKSIITAPITFKDIPLFQPHPAQVAFLSRP